MSRDMRTRLLFLGGVGIVSVGIWLTAAHAYARYCDAYYPAHDLLKALACFAGLHGGRLPSSEAEFRSCGLLKGLGGSAYRVRIPPDLGEWAVSGRELPELSGYEIAWGCNLRNLRVDRKGVVVDAGGHEVRLIKVSLPEPWYVDHSREYASYLLHYYAQFAKTARKNYGTTTGNGGHSPIPDNASDGTEVEERNDVD